MSAPRKVHLVGSIGLDSVEQVFAVTGRLLGRRLKRIPDGEPGPRRLWVSFQYPLLRASAFLRPDPGGAVRQTNRFPLLCLADGVRPEEVSFGELGYAREARASYQDFCAARARGDIAPGVRFQVCLPTPMGVVYAYCTEPDVVAIDRAYEAAMIREAAAICAAIPHADLCLQWDFCHEMLLLDGQPQDQLPTIDASADAIMARLARISAPIPPEVELGFHLCYGDFGAKHLIEPIDATKMVMAANAIAKAVPRRIDYVHMPIPIAWTEDRYIRPLADLALDPDTEIYLGLIHLADDARATQNRIDLARRYAPDFGVATECGIARARAPGLVRSILERHAAVTEEPPA